MNYTEIIRKLIGRIYPAGDSSIDTERNDNLKEMCDTVEQLISDIQFVSINKDRQEYSMKKWVIMQIIS